MDKKDRLVRRECLQEATVQAHIHITCIPQVYDAFEWKKNICIVMQWIKGVNLAQLLVRAPSQSLRLWMADRFVRSLTSLHAAGYAHRDLKPANSILSPSEGVFLVDFTFTKDVKNGLRSMSGQMKGTPAYMAPEIWRHSGEVDYMRADMYSAGVILKEILGDLNAGFIESTLLLNDPLKRPRSCVDFLKQWQGAIRDVQFDAAWLPMLRAMVAESHSKNCLEGAKQLLAAKRHDEAYDLLVESLEEYPEQAEAIKLLHSFPELARKHAFRRTAAVLAGAVCAMVLVLAVLLNVQKETGPPGALPAVATPASHGGSTRMKVRRAGRKGAQRSSGIFRHDTLPQAELSGTLLIKAFPGEGDLYIDGRKWLRPEATQAALPLPFGTHVLAWHEPGRGIVWREHVSILPFQLKGLTVAVR
jgi:hypothetical protein